MSRRKPAAPAAPPRTTTTPPSADGSNGGGGVDGLPGHDLPSPEVLDELLKAFSADAVDTGTMRQIDLDSPEVVELLAPTAPSPPAVEAESRSLVEGETRANPEAEANPETEGQVEAARSHPVLEVEVESPTPDDLPGPDAVVGDPLAAALAPADPADADPSPTAPDTAAGTVRTIRIDASDDPPDAVYLAAGDPLLAVSAGGRGLVGTDVAARGASDGVVFIDDQDVGLGETISIADASSATRMEPRLRERRIAVKRAAGRKRLRWALVAAVVLLVLVAGLAVLGSSLFSVESVKVQGAVYADKAAVAKVVEELRGAPVLRVDTDRAERELEAIPWVEAARVTTQFPSSATIELRERTPVATYQGPDGQFRVLDGKGRVLDVLASQPLDYLLLVAADAPNLNAGQFAPQGFVAAGGLARALTPAVRAVAESATVTPDGSDLRLQLQGDIEVRFGPARDLVTKLVRLQTKLPELADGGVRYVDVSTDEVTVG